MQKEERLKKVRSRKNFIATLVIIILLWLSVGGIVLFLIPEAPINLFFFFLTLFLALFLTLATILENTRRGFIVSLSIVVFLLLRYLAVGNVFNILLILGIAICFEIYFSKRF